jgi:hypothetical protein
MHSLFELWYTPEIEGTLLGDRALQSLLADASRHGPISSNCQCPRRRPSECPCSAILRDGTRTELKGIGGMRSASVGSPLLCWLCANHAKFLHEGSHAPKGNGSTMYTSSDCACLIQHIVHNAYSCSANGFAPPLDQEWPCVSGYCTCNSKLSFTNNQDSTIALHCSR